VDGTSIDTIEEVFAVIGIPPTLFS
jgi:hypothetical protein